MRSRTNVSLVAAIAAAMIFPAIAAAQPWPEARSGAYLGVQIAAITPQQVSALKLQDATGALITYVDQDGPACHAGLLENDVVVAFEGSKVQGPQQLEALIHTTPPQKTVTLTVMRAGQRKNIKVTLGSWNVMSHVRTFPASTMAFPPPPRVAPEIEVPSFTLVSSRHGLVVESLSPQLADFFGVPHGHGVLVRSVEAGSPAAAAGLKAGDIILKVNNETVHDMADWQRGMNPSGTKLPVNLWRDKREQTVVINLPNDSSQLRPGDWLDIDTNAQLMQQQLEALQPDIERAQQMLAQLGPSDQELQQMRREMENSMQSQQQDMEKMRTAIQNSVPSRQDFDAMQQQIQASIPSQRQMDEVRKQIEDSIQKWTPQMQREMKQLQKQMEQQQLDMQKMMQNLHSNEF
jgi:serine protease Do